MFDEELLIEFINRIINSEEVSKQDIKVNLEKFQDYLRLTKMVDDSVLGKISIILDCLDSLITLKERLGYIDVVSILEATESRKDPQYVKRRTSQTPYEDKHYHHYQQASSSSCGGGRVVSRSC